MFFQLLANIVLVLAAFSCAVQANAISPRSALLVTENEPHQVFVACAGNTFDFGAGVPITRRHVLTAASLVRGFTNWNIGYGSHQFARLQYIESHVAFIHPNYNPSSGAHNLGVIVLPSSLPVGPVQPVRMPLPSDGVFPRANQEGRLVGFGMLRETNATSRASPTPTMKTVYLTVNSNCTGPVQAASGQRATHFCAYDGLDGPAASTNNGDDSASNLCRGDVGDAFIVRRRGEQVLAGFATVVSQTCRARDPTAFVRIQAYLPWIETVTRYAEGFYASAQGGRV